LQTNGKKVIKVIRGNGLNELALFAGAGGGILGGHLLGWRTVCAVEWESYPASVLLARQNDGILPPFPIWDDVQTFDGNAWRGIVDVVSGGFPCQDISVSNTSGKGLDGERSGMWREMARIICEVRPQYAFIENSPMLTTRGLGTVLADLAKMGFDAEWGVLSAADVGANHLRERMWIVAEQKMGYTRCKHGQAGLSKTRKFTQNNTSNYCKRLSNVSLWDEKIESDIVRMDYGLASRVDRLKAIGNGQVPLCAATAWNILKGRLDERI
jgi:DNA (cytosine-5)-methyltransferase 1